MEAKQFNRLLATLGACKDARSFCEGKSISEAWNSCERGDWMLWLCALMAGKEGWPTRKQVVLASCACARKALKFVPEGETRPLEAIETAEKWANGNATLREVRAAAAAAYAAADATAAEAYAYAAAAYAYAAAYAAADATADDAYAYAAAAAYAYAADAYAYAAAAARTAARKECADIVRKELVFAALEEEPCTA